MPKRSVPATRIFMLLAAVLVVGGVVWQRYQQEFPDVEESVPPPQTDPASTVDDLKQHLEEHPHDDVARLKLALSFLQNFPESALVELQKISPEAENYLDAQRILAATAIELNRDYLAEEALLVLYEHDPADFAVNLSIAELCFRTTRYAAALPYAEKAVELQPERALSHLLLAEILFEVDRQAEMVAPLRRALELEPELLPAHANLAVALRHTGELDEAEQEVQWCLERDPKLFKVRRILAEIYWERGDAERAVAELKKVFEESPLDRASRLLLAEIQLFSQDPNAAYETLKPLYDEDPYDRVVISHLTQAANLSGRQEEALRLTQELAELVRERQASQREQFETP